MKYRIASHYIVALLGMGCMLAHAVDGVYEINQACVPVGCFPGDPPGFPVTITESGSYRLTGNLVLPDENTTAIVYSAADVSLDFNGFTIRGVTECQQNPSTLLVFCALAGSGRGIESLGNSTSLRVSNGSIHGVGNRAISLSDTNSAIIEDMVIRSSGSIGIHCGAACAVRNSRVELNLGHGISSLAAESRQATTIDNVVVNSSGGDGIRCSNLGGSCLVRNSIVQWNQGRGYHAGGDWRALIVHSHFIGNGWYGATESTIVASSFRDNNHNFPTDLQVINGIFLGPSVCFPITGCPPLP